ncbi:uncharacterized protein LOC144103416 [Amblyomma americanum]
MRHHKADVRQMHRRRSAVAEHCEACDHRIDLDGTIVLEAEADLRRRLLLESWHIQQARNNVNRSLWTLTSPYIHEPDSPMDITIVGESPSRSLLKWAGPKEWSAVLSTYAVMVCTSFNACDAEAGDMDCTNYETPVMKLPFDSTADTAYCVMVTATTRCGGDVILSRPAAAVVRTPAFRPPDVSKVKVTVVGNDSFTVSWQRPEGQFDYYWMEVTDSNAVLGSSEHRHVGSCVSGTLLRPHQTQVRCSQVKSCTNASLTIYTHVNGPPEQTSHGVTVEGIFIPGKDLHTPRNITFTWKSTTLTRVQWNPSAAPWAPARLYIVEICDAYGVCDASEQDRSCSHHETLKTWLDFESIADTEYCVLVTSGARCGSGIVRGTPASATFMTPTFGPPDVTNMTLEDIGVDSFTVSWERPKGHFDYYWVAVTDDEGSRGGSEHFHVDSCRNGTILHPEQTRITCGHLEACTNVSFNIRTHSNGPPARTSAGVTLGGIVIPGAAPGDFRAEATATSNTSVQIVIHVSDVKSCLLDDCSGDCHLLYGGGSAFRHYFSCNDHDGLTSVVTLDGLESDSSYSCTVTLTNVHKGQNMWQFEFLFFDTPKCE